MGYIAETDEDAKKEFFPSLKAHHDILGRERGWPSFDENMFEREVGSQAQSIWVVLRRLPKNY